MMLLLVVLMPLWLAIGSSCTGHGMGNHVLAQNECFTMTGDSLTEGGIVATASTPFHIESSMTRERLDSIALAYCQQAGHDPANRPAFVGGRPWRATEEQTSYPLFDCPQQLLGAIYNMNLDHIAEASNGRDTFDAQGDTTSLLCAMTLSLAWLDPVRTQHTLQLLVDNGRIVPIDGWPASVSHLAWATAAWNVYTATGDKHWLKQVHDVVQATLSADAVLLTDPTTTLLHGGSWRQRPPLPSWMQATDVAETQQLAGNALTMHAHHILELADEELGLSHTHATDAQHLKDAINQHLWHEPTGRYTAYLYGSVYPLRAPVTDNLAQALTVLWGIADDDRATTLLSHTPVSHKGVFDSNPDTASVEPYFVHTTWPATQAMWVMAAAQSGNEEMMRRGMAALLRAQALFQSRHITVKGQPRNDLLTAASSTAVMLRVLAGIRLTAEGIEFAPMVPACLPGEKTITGFRYRRAELDITLRGTGNDVAHMTVDGKPAESGFLPATLTGHHTVVIDLEPGHTANAVTIATNIGLPSTPEVIWTADSGCVTNYVAGGSYRFVANGHYGTTLNNMAFALTEASASQGTSVLSLVLAGRRGYGFAARPTLVCGSDSYTITLSTPTATDSIDIDVNVAHAGTHLLQLDYIANGNGYDAMLVSANTHHQGALHMPPAANESTSTSTTLVVTLLRGHNHLSLRRPSGFAHTATLTTVRICKL